MARFGDLFWKALVLTVIVFLLGVFLGFALERNRINDIEKEFQRIDLQWGDAKLQTLYYQNLEPRFCDSAIRENLEFADKVYNEGLKIDSYDKATFLSDGLELERKKYALLKVEFWLNTIVLREKCKAEYINLVYFFANDPELEIESEQSTQAEILKDLKEKYGKNLMLIPLPIDMDISMINIMKGTYDISKTPTILINEKIKVEGLQSFDELEALIKNEQK
ncbi:hypothetical protein J4443_04495 [Candidatus Woesearchaeota archaeon]|nr:hypothetical protein [Candidatus Woesearchaeota archaeon]